MHPSCLGVLVLVSSVPLGTQAPGGIDGDRRAQQALESHDRMLQSLRQLAIETPRSNYYLGEQSAERARNRVAKLAVHREPEARWRALQKVAHHEMRLGDTDAAIRAREQALDLVEELEGKLPAEVEIDARIELALAHLRKGEQLNCIARNTCESCILPIRGGGVHQEPSPSRRAARILTEVLEADRGNPRARWLLNLAHMTLGTYPDGVPEEWRIPPEVFASGESFPRFLDRAERSGLGVESLCGGVVIDDFDGDGVLDAVVSDWDPRENLRFYRGTRDGIFVDRTKAAGLTGISGGLNMLQADYDNDGHLDLLVLRGAWLRDRGKHPNSLLQNQGDGTFLDVSYLAGVAGVDYPTQTAAWADYDGDGDLDLYVGNESSQGVDAPCQLFRNDGDGTFTDVAGSAGVRNERFTKGVAWGDYDGDRLPDLYVSNQGQENRLYRNLGDGRFQDLALVLRVTRPIESFATWFWDMNNDGALDLLATTYVPRLVAAVSGYLEVANDAEFTELYEGDGGGSFKPVGRAMGLTTALPVMGCNFGDLDNDGYLDLYLGTGYPDYDGLVPNVMFRNRSGKSFVDVTTAGGFGHLQKGHAVAFADVDGDGDQDVFAELGGAYPGDSFRNVLFENPGFGNHWIVVRLVGRRSNRSAIGARIRCTLREQGEERSIYRHVNSGASFGANPLSQSIGLGRAERIFELEVYWPASDTTQVLKDLAADQRITIVEGEAGYQQWPRIGPADLPGSSTRSPKR